MNIQKFLAVSGLALGLIAGAIAQTAAPGNTNTPRIDQRAANEQARINQGVASGQLTPKEATRLQNRQDRIAKAEANAKADGNVTGKERAKLNRMEDKQSHRIHRQKHDAQRVAPAAAK